MSHIEKMGFVLTIVLSILTTYFQINQPQTKIAKTASNVLFVSVLFFVVIYFVLPIPAFYWSHMGDFGS